MRTKLGRVTRKTNQLRYSRTYAYDVASRLTEKTDRNGRVTKYTYDDADNLVYESWYADSSDTSFDYLAAFSYDHAGRRQSALGGEQPGLQQVDYTYTYEYNDRDRLEDRSVLIDGLAETVRFDKTYDDADRLTQSIAQFDTSLGLVDDATTAWNYDNLHRVEDVRQFGSGTPHHAVSGKRVDFTYDLASQLDTITRYSDVAGTSAVATTDYDYDFAGRLDTIEHFAGGNPSGTLLAGYGYDFDNRNRLLEIDFLPGNAGYTSPFDYSAEDVTYTYDNRDQLTDVVQTSTSTPLEDYDYDENGNRLSYATGDENRLLDDGTYTYSYDREGNRTSRTLKIGTSDEYLTEYTWDNRNRLVEVTFKNNSGTVTKTVEHTYDAENRWVTRVVDTDGEQGSADLEKTIFIHDGGQIVMELEDTITIASEELTKEDLKHRYLWGPERNLLLADEAIESLTDASQNETLWALNDHLGTVRDLVDNGQQVRKHTEYDSFGKITSETFYDKGGSPIANPETHAEAVEQLFGYTGHALDETDGTNVTQYRRYDTSTGQWLSQDPTGYNAGDANLYRYVGNKAATYVDPDGLHEAPIRPINGGVWFGTPESGWYWSKGGTAVKWVGGSPDFSSASGAIISRGGHVADVQIDFDDVEIECKDQKAYEREQKKLRRQHAARANAKMREKLPKWKQPKNTTWHHVDGTGRMQLVSTSLHQSQIPHRGGFNHYIRDLVARGRIKVGGTKLKISGGTIVGAAGLVLLVYSDDPLGDLVFSHPAAWCGTANAAELPAPLPHEMTPPSDEWFEYESNRRAILLHNARLILQQAKRPVENGQLPVPYISHPGIIEEPPYVFPWHD